MVLRQRELLLSLVVVGVGVVVFTTGFGGACTADRAAVAAAPGLPNRDAAQFLRIEGPLARSRLAVTVLVDGQPTVATFDTGATKTTITTGKLEAMGLNLALPAEPTLVLGDANGARVGAYETTLPSIMAAGRWFEDHPTVVIKSPEPLMLLGYDIIRQFDVVIAGDEGVVAMYPPGTLTPKGERIPLRLSDDQSTLLIDVNADGKEHVAKATLIVDTGADGTTFPSSVAMMAGVPTDLRFQQLSMGVASIKREPGYYDLRPLRLGAFSVGRVVAHESLNEDSALFGVDVMRRFQTTITSPLAGPPAMWLLPMPERGFTIKPIKGRCSQAVDPGDDDDDCIDIRLRAIDSRDEFDTGALNLQGLGDDLALAQMGINSIRTAFRRNEHVCLAVHVRADVAKLRVEVTLRESAGSGALSGERLGAILDMRHGGRVDSCLPLPEETDTLLGLDHAVPLTIEAVRVDGDLSADICPMPACIVARGQVYGVPVKRRER